MALAPGTAEAICTSLRLAFDQLTLNERQTRQVNAGIDELIRQLSDPEDNESENRKNNPSIWVTGKVSRCWMSLTGYPLPARYRGFPIVGVRL